MLLVGGFVGGCGVMVCIYSCVGVYAGVSVCESAGMRVCVCTYVCKCVIF